MHEVECDHVAGDAVPFGASRRIQGSTVRRASYSDVPLPTSPSRRPDLPVSARVPSNAADEIKALRSQNEALQRQLALKDQGLERLRQRVHERALMLSHQQAADVQQTRREAGSVIGELVSALGANAAGAPSSGSASRMLAPPRVAGGRECQAAR